MNFGRPMGRVGRWAVGPLGWVVPGVALAGAGLVLATVRWPVEGWRFSLMDVPYYGAAWEWRGRWEVGMTWVDAAYTAGLGLVAVAAALWVLRLLARGVAVARYRPPAFQRGRFWGRSGVVAVVLGVAVAGMGVGWPYRLGQRWAAEVSQPVRAGAMPALLRPTFASWLRVDDGRSRVMARAAVRYGDEKQKVRGLKLMAEHVPAEVVTYLPKVAAAERHPAVAAIQVSLIGLARQTVHGPWLESLLTDYRAEVRAAAADALGVLRGPAYQLAEGGFAPLTTATDPPIGVTTSRVLTGESDARPPATARGALERLMLTGATAAEREAAARALVGWPPVGYSLRLAEWGVWQTVGAGGAVAPVKAQLESIPPFVHRAGNPAGEFANRVGPLTVYWKPVIHLTASAPMAVDVQVAVRDGRVWFGFPRPDDFVLALGAGGPLPLPLKTPQAAGAAGVGPPVARFDPAGLPPLTGLHTGYPWLLPAHPSYPRGVWPGRGPGPGDAEELAGLGLRWQSVIVSPAKLTWMAPPAVGAEGKFAWWSRLREVECSWVSSRGEGERFLYYDGPTMAAAPVVPRVERDGRLRFAVRDYYEPGVPGIRAAAARRQGLLVEVAPGAGAGGAARVRAGAVAVVDKDAAPAVEAVLGREVGAGAAERLLRDALVERGLTPSEAGGLLDCWWAEFFESPGLRFLTLISPEDYEEACPLTVRPAPTERVRVGVVFTELGG
jgi:hypothetical protein